MYLNKRTLKSLLFQILEALNGPVTMYLFSAYLYSGCLGSNENEYYLYRIGSIVRNKCVFLRVKEKCLESY